MFYPMKFESVYKDYLWGGRNLTKIGKEIPNSKVAESWELSCHPDGMSMIKNGPFRGRTLQSLIDEYGKEIIGNARKDFPLLVKLIDANDKLSVQVHPDDEYALANEGEYGKNEMWYILAAKPDASLVYDVKPDVTKESFTRAVIENRVEDCLQTIPVRPGDFVYIPAGMVHAIGDGIVLAEVQQNSNTTYRIFDYHRKDAHGNSRPLHTEKAMEVIHFRKDHKAIFEGLHYELPGEGTAAILVANTYFSVELYKVFGAIRQSTEKRQFHIYLCIEGEGTVQWDENKLSFHKGETFLIPSALGTYSITGDFKALKAYVPELNIDIYKRMQKMGFTKEQLFANISGLL